MNSKTIEEENITESKRESELYLRRYSCGKFVACENGDLCT